MDTFFYIKIKKKRKRFTMHQLHFQEYSILKRINNFHFKKYKILIEKIAIFYRHCYLIKSDD